MLTKDFAICIRVLDYSETSQIVTLFTQTNGKLSAIAKGSKRAKSAFDGPIEMFSFGEIVFSPQKNDKLAILTEFEQQPAIVIPGKNLSALNCALFTAELINQLTDEYDPHSELFENFLDFLRNVGECDNKPDSLKLLILFQLNLLKELGLKPILGKCSNCKSDYSQKWGEVYFSNTANGIICRDCEVSFADKTRFSRDAASCLADLKLIVDANKETLSEIEKVLVYHFMGILNKPLKMVKHIINS
jgi:DNA repair protein RecO (recombination protein O)